MEFERPGAALANRPLHFFWLVDCSGSMFGEKIATVNNAIQSCIKPMQDAAENNPNAHLFIRTLKFATGANWVSSNPIPVEQFVWDDLAAGGVTDMGKAFELLAAQLTIPPMSDRALPPVIVLLSDGQPTDNYKKNLDKLLHLPWGKKAVRIAISIGKDVDDDVLLEFTGNREYVLQANNAEDLTKMIKWASTVASVVSAPGSQEPISQQADDTSMAGDNNTGGAYDMGNIPQPSAGVVW
ncbi:MAG: VWA domain-containing protein [Lachnospiraceae bacterium]|nr:VWA domain-containing protein [Lachnospiraceae bacterium]